MNADRHDAEDGSAAIIADLSRILQESLKALAAAGQADAACRFAARGCVVFRKKNPQEWGRFNALLHRLSPMTDDIVTDDIVIDDV